MQNHHYIKNHLYDLFTNKDLFKNNSELLPLSCTSEVDAYNSKMLDNKLE